MTYYPGETNLRAADVIVINKVGTADYANVREIQESIAQVNPDATVVLGASPLFVDHPEEIRGKRVLVVEDGPTLTHGEMSYGAGYVAAQRFGAAEIIDPRPMPWLRSSILTRSTLTPARFCRRWATGTSRCAILR